MSTHTFFQQLDLQKQTLDKIDYKSIIDNSSILIKNVNDNNILDGFIKFSKDFGEYLDYENKPYYLFDGNTQQEIEYHSDGVSCLDENRIPKYLFFYAKSWPQNSGGEFKISYTPNIIKKIPQKYTDILLSQKLQFLNYAGTDKKFIKPAGVRGNVVSFEKYALRKIHGEYKLDLFLPIDKITEDIKWEYLMKFEKLSLNASLDILNDIKIIAKDVDCEKTFEFNDNDILVFNNNLFLHGRKKFTKKINRKLYRIQILA